MHAGDELLGWDTDQFPMDIRKALPLESGMPHATRPRQQC